MTINEFFYWLQGYFELSGSQAALTPTQAACICRHVELARVWASERAVGIPENLTVIGALAKLIADGADGADALTSAIRSDIHDQFEHVIDPQAGGPEQQAKLNAIHNGGRPHRPGEPVYRC
jgi:hypothetical protein